MKATRAGRDGGLQPAGAREVTFYRQVAPLMPGGPFLRCHDAEFSSGCGHVLLDDLSDTHGVITDWPLPPSTEGVRADRGHVGDLPCKIPPGVRWPHLHRIVAAFEDLDCAALLP